MAHPQEKKSNLFINHLLFTAAEFISCRTIYDLLTVIERLLLMSYYTLLMSSERMRKREKVVFILMICNGIPDGLNESP